MKCIHNHITFSEKVIVTVTIKTLNDKIENTTKENKIMKEPIIDLRTRMQDNLIFSGVLEKASDNPKTKIKDLVKTNMPHQAWPHPVYICICYTPIVSCIRLIHMLQ